MHAYCSRPSRAMRRSVQLDFGETGRIFDASLALTPRTVGIQICAALPEVLL